MGNCQNRNKSVHENVGGEDALSIDDAQDSITDLNDSLVLKTDLSEESQCLKCGDL